MTTKKITIIGSGNLGLSIAEGLTSKSAIDKKNLLLTEKNADRIKILLNKNFNISEDNISSVNNSDIIIIAVKPKNAEEVLKEISDNIKPEKHILISCVAGLNSQQILRIINPNTPLFRIMPNTAIAVGESMTCISEFNTTEVQKKEIENIFSKLGKVIFINEELMSAATVLAGCGVAFAMRFIRAVTEAGVEMGVDAYNSQLIASQILKGGAELILSNDTHPEKEIDKVTTPGGITITALNEMEHYGFSAAIIKGLIAAFNKMNKK
jgi:pyrroline-5-carboxylate reductase